MRTSQYGYTVRWGGKAIVATDDGGYLLGGPLHYFGAGDADLWLVKLDNKGKIEWQYTLGGHDYEWLHWVEQTADGGFILAGLTQSFGKGGTDLWLIKLNDLAEVEWQRCYGGEEDDSASVVRAGISGGYVVVGETYSFGSGGQDIITFKLFS